MCINICPNWSRSFYNYALVAFRLIFEMPQKLRFIWDEKNIDQKLETFDLKTDIQGLTQTYLCGRFNQLVTISGIEVETMHFIDLKIINCYMVVKMNHKIFVDIQEYNDLSLTIITPGISRNAFCLFIIQED